MGEWECIECGHIHEGERPPKTCPDCGADSDRFEFYEFDDEDEFDDEEFEEYDDEEDWDEEDDL